MEDEDAVSLLEERTLTNGEPVITADDAKMVDFKNFLLCMD
jgi:hypothetical protein